MKRKNNKGFTLIEVIAVIVLLGILAIMVVPKIFELVDDSRKSIYLEDAIRLISKAQYTMNSKSVKIDKPDTGEIIVFSMKYLSSADFQNPPNGGNYLTESSFVVVKNINGKYVYSTMLVEKTKDGLYAGVELSSERALTASNAISHVKYFDVNELAFVDTSSGIVGGSFLDAAYISNHMNGEDTAETNSWKINSDDDIIGYYNNEIDDEEAITDTVSPKISAKFSTSGSLQTTLTISATDADNETEELTVYIKISRNANDSYPSISGTGESYGTGTFFTKDIDFSKFNPPFSYSQQETAYVYIVVKDPQGNYARKRLSYDIHYNEPPTIATFTVTKNPQDQKNMPTARVTLVATDDMDSVSDLLVCFTQDKNARTCSNYQRYGDLFGTGNTYNYTFKDSSGKDIIEPDGVSRDLKVFVKDSLGFSSNAETSYEVYKNLPPEITTSAFGTSCATTGDFIMTGKCDCPSTKCNGLKVRVFFTARDDITEADDLSIRLVEIAADGKETNPVSMSYSQYRNGNGEYTFTGSYDGKDRTLRIEVQDQYGKKTTSEVILSNVYKNQKPYFTVLGTSFITSAETVCSGSNACNGNGGSYEANLNFTVGDDLTNESDLKVCISENADDCKEANKNTNKFVLYPSLSKQYTFTHPDITDGLIYPDTQITKHLYAAVVDGAGLYQAYNDLQAIDYPLYHNSAPTIKGNYFIMSTAGSRNLRTVQLNFSSGSFGVEDDFNNYTVRFCYAIGSGSLKCSKYQSYTSFVNQFSNYFEFKDADDEPLSYEGQTITTKIQVKDNYGDKVYSNPVTYQLYADSPPVIDINNTGIESSTSGYNNYITYVHFKVTDYEDTYSVCVTPNGTCRDEDYQINGDGKPFDGTYGEVYTITVDGHEVAGWDEEYRDEDTRKQLTLFVKDSHGNFVSQVLNYDLYHLCSDENNMIRTDAEPTYSYSSGNVIGPTYCEGACYRSIPSSPNETVFKRTNDKFGKYNETYIYQDTLVGYTCPVVKEVSVGCNYVDCFNTGEAENPNVISMVLEDIDQTWYYSNPHVTRDVKVDKPYCENLGDDDYFYPGDYRCNDDFCPEKATEHCIPVVNAEEAADIQHRAEVNDHYNEAMLVFEEVKQQAYYNYLRVKENEPGTYDPVMDRIIPSEFHQGTISYLDSCALVKDHQGDEPDNVSWRNSTNKMCTGYDTCLMCHDEDNPPPLSVCEAYKEYEEVDECSVLQVTDSSDQILCSAFLNYNYCIRIDEITEAFYALYDGAHTPPRHPLFVTQAEYDANYSMYVSQGYTDDEIFIIYDKVTHLAQCEQEQTAVCLTNFTFCDEEFTSVKTQVLCGSDDKDLGPFNCRMSDYLDGYCLEDDPTCSDDDTGCRKVCYKAYDCQEEIESRPVTFTCHGFYTVYQSSHEGDKISLQKTGMRICPEFMGNFPQFYTYDASSSTPFIEFNPSELGGE